MDSKDPLDDDLFEGTFNENKNYEDSVLRAHGLDPDELSDEEKRRLLTDYDDPSDPDDSRLSNLPPDD